MPNYIMGLLYNNSVRLRKISFSFAHSTLFKTPKVAFIPLPLALQSTWNLLLQHPLQICPQKSSPCLINAHPILKRQQPNTHTDIQFSFLCKTELRHQEQMYYFKLVLVSKNKQTKRIPVGRISASVLLEKIKKNKEMKKTCGFEKSTAKSHPVSLFTLPVLLNSLIFPEISHLGHNSLGPTHLDDPEIISLFFHFQLWSWRRGNRE